MFPDNFPDIRRLHVAVESAPAVVDNFNQRLMVADAPASDRLYLGAPSQQSDMVYECRMYLPGTAGHAAGPHSNANLDG